MSDPVGVEDLNATRRIRKLETALIEAKQKWAHWLEVAQDQQAEAKKYHAESVRLSGVIASCAAKGCPICSAKSEHQGPHAL